VQMARPSNGAWPVAVGRAVRQLHPECSELDFADFKTLTEGEITLCRCSSKRSRRGKPSRFSSEGEKPMSPQNGRSPLRSS